MSLASDGGYLLSGDMAFSGIKQPIVVKLDYKGDIQWGSRAEFEATETPRDALETPDGGALQVGTYKVSGSITTIFIIKYDAQGTLEWSKEVGDAGNNKVESMIATADGGYAILGYSDEVGGGVDNIILLKLDSAFNIEWTKTIGEVEDDHPKNLIELGTGGFILVGYTSKFSSKVGFVVRMDAHGEVLWTNSFYDQYSELKLHGVVESPDGASVYFAG